MGQALQRAAVAFGILAAGVLFWIGYSNRSVDRPVYFGAIEARLAALDGLRPAEDTLPVHRVAAARAAGRKLQAFEEVHQGTGTEIDQALARRVEGFDAGAGNLFSDGDRDLILAQGEVAEALGALRKGGVEGAGNLEDDESVMPLILLSEYQALAISSAVARADEEAVVAEFEALLRLSEDLFRSDELLRRIVGGVALSSSLTSAKAVELRRREFPTEHDREAFAPVAMQALLDAVPSAEGRKKLIDAIERAEASLPEAKAVVISEFVSAIEGLRQYAELEHEGDRAIPMGWLKDLEALVAWQDRVLALFEDPTFVPTEAAFEPLQIEARRIPGEAQYVISPLWTPMESFAETKRKSTRAKRWIRTGKPN